MRDPLPSAVPRTSVAELSSIAFPTVKGAPQRRFGDVKDKIKQIVHFRAAHRSDCSLLPRQLHCSLVACRVAQPKSSAASSWAPRNGGLSFHVRSNMTWNSTTTSLEIAPRQLPHRTHRRRAHLPLELSMSKMASTERFNFRSWRCMLLSLPCLCRCIQFRISPDSLIKHFAWAFDDATIERSTNIRRIPPTLLR